LIAAVLCGMCSAEIGYFFQLSDTHMQTDYYKGSDPKKGCYAGKGNAGPFGDYNCRSPYPVEVTAMNLLSQLAPNECPDKDPLFILWTGDSGAKRGGTYSESIIKYELKNITNLFTKLHSTFGGKVPIYPVIGNHDTYPQHQMSSSGSWVYDTVYDLWEPFLPTTAAETLRKHGYYSVKVTTGLRLIVVNTVLYYVHNTKCTGEPDPGGQIAWMRQQLGEAKKAGEHVYIAGHVPVRVSDDCFLSKFEKPFLDGMEGYHDIIMGSFWGHVHIDAFQLYGNVTASGKFHVAHLTSMLGSDNGRHPSFRRFIFDSSKGFAIQDWRVYHMDLPAVNKAGKIKWNTLYDAKTYFDIPDATAASIHNLAYRMRSNLTLANMAHKVRRGGGPMEECGASCQKSLVCGILNPMKAQYDKCVG